jgi:uncharacterized protein YjiS (DUF1127 family)
MASLNNRATVKKSMRAPRGLSPLQRAYLMGFRRARIQARRDVNALADQFEDLSEEVYGEVLGAQREMARLRAIDHALEAERGDTLLRSERAQSSQPVAFSTDLERAAVGAPYSMISRLAGKLRTWRQRERERAELARMSQHELHDIGVSSSEHWTEISKPFWRK